MTLPLLDIDAPRPMAPRISAFTRYFWDALAEGRFVTTRCRSCDRISFPPRAICPHCWAGEPDWAEMSGAGRLYSYTVNHVPPRAFARHAPYAIGIVELREGVRLLCSLHGAEALQIGMAMQMIVLRHTDGPLFGARSASNKTQT